ncbi:MAG: hypothetical protein QN183_13750 [Armatimonadota bacterium]|nr:hypothetical protein [Armatimonadota bacterium]
MIPQPLLDTLLAILTRYVPDANQRERALAEWRSAYASYLASTSSLPYALARVAVIAGALVDLFAWRGRAWAEVADTFGIARPTAGLVEIAVVLWLFVGPDVVQPLARVVAAAVERTAWQAAAGPARPAPVPPRPAPDPVDEHRQLGKRQP